jgi:hypothetical protein
MGSREQIEAILERQQKAGVLVQYAGIMPEGPAKEIIWRPGDPNALAQAIINNVGEKDTHLTLDGWRFVIRRTS